MTTINFPTGTSSGQTYCAPNGNTYTWDGYKWTGQVTAVVGPSGPRGAQGSVGQQGVSVTLKGTVATSSSLPGSGNSLDDGYIAQNTGHLWFWGSDNAWHDAGQIVGPSGPTGPTGPASTVSGPSGPTGVDGARGYQGAQGAAGGGSGSGSQGAQGYQGTAGNQGATGSQGYQGTAGPSGPSGAQGSTGAQGAAGSGGGGGSGWQLTTSTGGSVSLYFGKNPFPVGGGCYSVTSIGSYTNILGFNSATMIAMAGCGGIGGTGTFVIENVKFTCNNPCVPNHPSNYNTIISTYGGYMNFNSFTLTNVGGTLRPVSNGGLAIGPGGSVLIYGGGGAGGGNLVPQSGGSGVTQQSLGGCWSGYGQVAYWNTTYSQSFVMPQYIAGGIYNTPGAVSSGTIKFSDGSVQVTAYTGSFNTSTLVARAITATNATNVLGSTQTAITTLGTLTSLSVSGSVNVGGTVTMPNRPAFRVYGAGTTNNLGTTVNTNGILNGNNYAVDYQQGTALNTSTGVFTAPIAGLYSIHLNARVVSNTTSSAQVIVIKNYATTSSNMVMWETGPNPSINHFGVSTVARLAVGDTLVTKVTVGAINFDINDNWAVAYIG